MTPLLRQHRATRASLTRQPKRGGLVIASGRQVHGGTRRAGSYWARRLRERWRRAAGGSVSRWVASVVESAAGELGVEEHW